jgi:hypothetical protein
MPKQLRLKGYEFAERWRDALELAARVCLGHRRVKLFFASFLSDGAAPTVLGEHRSLVRLAKRQDYWVGSLSSKKPKTQHLQFGLYKSGENAWTAFSLAETIASENLLLRLLRSLSPQFSGAYLSSGDIRIILRGIEESCSAEISVNKAVAYSYMREGEISFKKQPYHAVFNRAENEGMFVDKVDFVMGTPASLHAFVARNGVAKFLSGSLQIFLESVLDPIVKTASGKHRVFAQSSRKSGDTHVSPIDIQFGETVFKDRDDSVTFLSALDLLPRSGIAIMHENPYVHVSLIDFFDGSAFDIFATTGRAVTIIPQVDASAFSLNRLCNHIFENFREGEIVKPQPRSWGLEDVLT